MSGLQAAWNETMFLIPNWKWLGIIAGISIGFLVQPAAKWALSKFKKSQAENKSLHEFFGHFLDLKIETPLSWIVTVAFWHFALNVLGLPEKMDKYLGWILQAILSFYLLRLAYMAVDAVGSLFAVLAKKADTQLDNQIISMVTKTMKVVVVVFGVLIIVQSFGMNVMSVLAGLGLGGLALALAAQDTAANLFGSIMIILDKPFKVGDFIKVAGTEGTVEDIGFRSTRLRTPYSSLISIPNATVAKEQIDNLGARPNRRIRHVVGLAYDTPLDKIQKFMDQIKYMLTQNPDTLKDSITVRFNLMGDFNLQVLVQCYVIAAEWADEMEIQEEVLMDVMKAAKMTDVAFAFPTQTLHVESFPTEKLPNLDN